MIDPRRIKITTQPVTEPVSVAEAKEQLHIDHDDEDAYVDALIVAARSYCEMVTQRSFVTRTYTAYMDCWPAAKFTLPFPPLASVTSIKYYDDAGSPAATVSSSDYIVDAHSEPGRVALKSSAAWPTVNLREMNGVEVIYTAGYGNAGAVPDLYKAAIKLLIGHLYENREAVTTAQGISVVTTPLGLEALLLADRGGWN